MIPVLLLLALPASGKSEIRRYLEHADPGLPSLPLGPTIQLDDYPYVHVMRRISAKEQGLGLVPTFFAASDAPFTDPRDWLTLIHLLDEDFAALARGATPGPDPEMLIDRIGAARRRAGIVTPCVAVERQRVARAIAGEAAELAAAFPRMGGAALEGATVIIEFARGGPDGATAPLPHPLGYRPSLAALSPVILERAAVLYVWVTPEESRQRNRQRALPGDQGDASILHHGVPEPVMRSDYGMDDVDWLERTSGVPGAIRVETGDGAFLLPMERFDNRVDRTSFLRDDPSTWPTAMVAALHGDLARSLTRLDRAGSGAG